MKRYLFVALVMLILVLPGLVLLSGCSAPSTDTGTEAQAAIIDQLYSLQPNQAFIDDTVEVLNAYGFEVDVYQGDEVTVGLYRRLPAYGYKLIIFRAHSGLFLSGGEVVKATWVFTNEPYSPTKYVDEQLSGRLAQARVREGEPFFFAIGSEFVTDSMDGQFDNTVVIMMGCSCIYLYDLAVAFAAKGCSAYLAWDAPVGLDYVDEATTNLIENLCAEDMTIKQAVDKTMSEVGPDPDYQARLKYYPLESGNSIIKELTR